MNTFSVFSRGPAEHEHFAGSWLDQCFTVTSFSIPFWAGDDSLCKKPQTARKRKWHCSTLHHCSLATHGCFHKSTPGHVRHSFDHRMQFLHNLFFLFWLQQPFLAVWEMPWQKPPATTAPARQKPCHSIALILFIPCGCRPNEEEEE